MSYYYERRGGFFSNLPTIVKNILIINIFMLIFTELKPEFMYGTFALYHPLSPFFRWWQPVTHMFMHGGFWHLFLNMFAFVMFGSTLERQWGPKKFLIFYLITGLGAAALHLLVVQFQLHPYMEALKGNAMLDPALGRSLISTMNTPMVGASGAIYGVLMGYALLFPDVPLTLLFPPVTLKAKWMVLVWLVIELVTGVFSMGGGVAHFAHLGGMLFGWLLIIYWKKRGTMYDYDD